jgi:hypothetical protein
MDSKRKRIYVAVIVGCLCTSAAVLYFGLFSVREVPSQSNPIVLENSNPSASPTSNNQAINRNTKSYSVPAVFPNDTKFDWTVLDNGSYRTLSAIPSLKVEPAQLGKENLFSK